MIEISNVALQYKGIGGENSLEALQNITFSIAPGERVVIIGPSGCGKSSLLYLLAGLFPATAGTIKIADKMVLKPREEVALILQDQGLFPWKTVLENAELGLVIRKTPKKPRRIKVLKILKSLGIGEFIEKYPAQLSGGQRQRVAIARALAQEPKVLLMDEPFSALDALTRENLQDMILNLWQKSPLTMVLVTHSIEEAVFLGEKIVVLSKQPGRIEAIIPNAHSGDQSFRQSSQFYNQCNSIRKILTGESQ